MTTERLSTLRILFYSRVCPPRSSEIGKQGTLSFCVRYFWSIFSHNLRRIQCILWTEFCAWIYTNWKSQLCRVDWGKDWFKTDSMIVHWTINSLLMFFHRTIERNQVERRNEYKRSYRRKVSDTFKSCLKYNLSERAKK